MAATEAQNKIYTLVGYKLSIYDLDKLDTREEEVKRLVHPRTKLGDDGHCDNNSEDFKYCPDCGKENYEVSMIVDDIYLFDSDLIDFHSIGDHSDLMDYVSNETSIKTAKNFSPALTPVIEKDKSMYLVYKSWVDPTSDKPCVSITDAEFLEMMTARAEFEKNLSTKSRMFLKSKDFGVYVFGVDYEDFLCEESD